LDLRGSDSESGKVEHPQSGRDCAVNIGVVVAEDLWPERVVEVDQLPAVSRGQPSARGGHENEVLESCDAALATVDTAGNERASRLRGGCLCASHVKRPLDRDPRRAGTGPRSDRGM